MDQVAKPERVNAALRKIELDFIFVSGLQPLHVEGFNAHGGDFTRFSRQNRVRCCTILTVPDNPDRPGDMATPRPRATMSSAIAPNLARIPAGDFLMGAADAEEHTSDHH